jgi:hypothetical protein
MLLIPPRCRCPSHNRFYETAVRRDVTQNAYTILSFVEDPLL